jgi:tetratricopeptide (TPR) repeat protein
LRSDNLLKYIIDNKDLYGGIRLYTIGEYIIGNGYLKKGDYKLAVEYLQKANELLPDRKDIQSDLVQAKEKLASMN